MKIVETNNVKFSNNLPFVLISGPCQIESLEHTLNIAEEISGICNDLGIPYVFKASYDKANRSSVNGARGVGIDKGLDILSAVKSKFGCDIITDVHDKEQARIASQVVDILQIPAFLCRQTDLLIAAGETGKVINVKKGQFLAPWDMKNVASKIVSTGNDKILLCERGTSFGYNMLVSDFRSLPIMAKTEYPVVFDATHSVQLPGGLGASTGGQAEFVEPLAMAAAAVGCSSIFIETHEDPSKSPSDGPNMVPLKELKRVLQKIKSIDDLVKSAA